MLAVLRREPLAWVLVGVLLSDFRRIRRVLDLPAEPAARTSSTCTPADAGFAPAGFVVLATLLRPVGGWLSDKIGGARVLSIVFFGVVPFALLLAWPSILPFTVGALGCAAMLGPRQWRGLQTGAAVFPERNRHRHGTGRRDGRTGRILSAAAARRFQGPAGRGLARVRSAGADAALLLWLVNGRVFLPRERAARCHRTAEHSAHRRSAPAPWATLWTGLLVAAIVVGSRNLENFDAALVIYTFAVIFATWGVVYHYNVWLEKPPTRLYWDRGWQLFRKRELWQVCRGAAKVGHAPIWSDRRFIRQRSRLRWWMHQFLFWGCMLAMAITFPLVFGWIGFKAPRTTR